MIQPDPACLDKPHEHSQFTDLGLIFEKYRKFSLFQGGGVTVSADKFENVHFSKIQSSSFVLHKNPHNFRDVHNPIRNLSCQIRPSKF